MHANEPGIFRIGPIRPPSEANSLLLQITEGCTWNRCKFCDVYRHSPFKIFSVESIKNDIDVIKSYADLIETFRRADGSWDRKGISQAMSQMTQDEKSSFYVVFNWLVHGGQNVFLQDGNSLALKADRVLEVLQYLRSKFPKINRVTTYSRAETLAKISVEQFKALKEAGLDRIHSGYETGSDKVLELIHKGVTAEQEIQAGKNIKAAGIELSVYFMPGIGGKALSRDNALETAQVISAINPDYVRIRTAVVKIGTELWEDYQRGSYQLCSENDKVMEIKLLIENARGCTGMLVSDHIINLLQGVEGRLDVDKARMLSMIEAYLALPELERRMFQLARRWGMVSRIEAMKELTPQRHNEIKKICLSISSEVEWSRKLNEMMNSFI